MKKGNSLQIKQHCVPVNNKITVQHNASNFYVINMAKIHHIIETHNIYIFKN